MNQYVVETPGGSAQILAESDMDAALQAKAHLKRESVLCHDNLLKRPLPQQPEWLAEAMNSGDGTYKP